MQVISNASLTIKEIWSLQHPIMHKWFMISGLALFTMFTLLFVAV